MALSNVDKYFTVKKKFTSRYNCSLFDVDLKENVYDLAVLSHLLYYIRKADWFEALTRVYRALRPGGIMVVVLNGDLDKRKLIERFSGYAINTASLIDQCLTKLSHKVEVFLSAEKFVSRSVNMMTHICGMHLNDGNAV